MPALEFFKRGQMENIPRVIFNMGNHWEAVKKKQREDKNDLVGLHTHTLESVLSDL